MKSGTATELSVSTAWTPWSGRCPGWCPTINPSLSMCVPVSQYVRAGTYRGELSSLQWRAGVGERNADVVL
jgi:hypothetical protein